MALPEDGGHLYALDVDELAAPFGRAVRFARQRRGWQQEHLATLAKINRTYLSDLELGRGNPTLDVIRRLAAALGMAASELVAAAEREAG